MKSLEYHLSSIGNHIRLLLDKRKTVKLQASSSAIKILYGIFFSLRFPQTEQKYFFYLDSADFDSDMDLHRMDINKEK